VITQYTDIINNNRSFQKELSFQLQFLTS